MTFLNKILIKHEILHLVIFNMLLA